MYVKPEVSSPGPFFLCTFEIEIKALAYVVFCHCLSARFWQFFLLCIAVCILFVEVFPCASEIEMKALVYYFPCFSFIRCFLIFYFVLLSVLCSNK